MVVLVDTSIINISCSDAGKVFESGCKRGRYP
jgi:hypothetical protein